MTAQAVGTPILSVVIPARDAAATLGACLRGLRSQSISSDQYEVIVVVDRDSRDGTGRVAREAGVRVLLSTASGAAAARNAGIAAARGIWIAFTDADCIPSRTWLAMLLSTVDESSTPTLGAAGRTIGHESISAAARFVDLSGGLHAARHLAHERYPWAPTGNVMYRRAALEAVGGFDERFLTYEGCDLHTRLLRQVGGGFAYVPEAVVLHHHRAGWRAYWRQQVGYGVGYGQFFRRYERELAWTPADEVRAWLGILVAMGRAVAVRAGERGLLARGTAVKQLAQRIGFVQSYWNPVEARRWRHGGSPSLRSAT